MKITKKIELASDSNRLVLHKEGLFYKAYNENAKLFVEYINQYKVSAKYIKLVKQTVFSIGFPSVSLISNIEKIEKKLEGKQLDSTLNTIVFSIPNVNKSEGYLEWKEQQTRLAKENEAIQETGSNKKKFIKLVTMLNTFELVNHTPMEAMNFIQELKNEYT